MENCRGIKESTDVQEYILENMDIILNKVISPDKEEVSLKKSYRLSCKHLLLTYPRLDKTKEQVLGALMEKKLSIKDYIVARELHNDGTPHIHVYLKLNLRVNYKDPHCLDIFGKHGSYESVRSIKAIYKYLVKGGDFITNLHTLDNQIFDLKEYLLKLVHMGDIKQAREVLINSSDLRILGNFNKWLKDLEALYALKHPTKAISSYNKEQFEYPEEVVEWFLKDKNLTLLLVGPSGFGKTQGVLSLMADSNPLLVRDINDLKY